MENIRNIVIFVHHIHYVSLYHEQNCSILLSKRENSSDRRFTPSTMYGRCWQYIFI